MNPDQSLIWVHIVCTRLPKNISRWEEQMAKAETGSLIVRAFTIHGSVGGKEGLLV